jgi:hypothetical protein
LVAATVAVLPAAASAVVAAAASDLFQNPSGDPMSRKSLFQLSLSVLAALGLSSGCTRVTPEQAFWMWFQKNEASLFDFEKDRNKIFDKLAAEMHRVEPHLTFEFGPKKDGRREFTISADGIREAFPKVETLYAAAPPLPRWKIMKFRQRHDLADISYGNVIVHSDAVAIKIERTGQKADIELYIPGYSGASRETYIAIAFLLLDQALGEYDVETRVGDVQVKAISEAPAHAQMFEALPKSFDALFVGN